MVSFENLEESIDRHTVRLEMGLDVLIDIEPENRHSRLPHAGHNACSTMCRRSVVEDRSSRAMAEHQAAIHTEWIILCDHVEVINGKVYMMGGGWSFVTINQEPPVAHPCGIAVSFSVPWHETNQVHPISVEVLDPDGTSLVTVEADLEVGRPPGTQMGTAQRVPIAFNMALSLTKPGPYVARTRVHGQESLSERFSVVEGPGLQLARNSRPPQG